MKFVLSWKYRLGILTSLIVVVFVEFGFFCLYLGALRFFVAWAWGFSGMYWYIHTLGDSEMNILLLSLDMTQVWF